MKRSTISAAILSLVSIIVYANPAVSDGASRNPSWSGFYLGVQGGRMTSETDGGLDFPPMAVWHTGVSTSIWGGQIGVQHQFGSIVLGVEANLVRAASDKFGSATCIPLVFCGAGSTMHGRLDNLLTVGPRLGWAAGNWMPYATGGIGWADVENHSQFGPVLSEGTRARHAGWYIGGGIDGALTQNWVLGIEYRHYEFEAKAAVPVVFATGVANPGDRWTLDPRADTVTARLSYKFGP